MYKLGCITQKKRRNEDDKYRDSFSFLKHDVHRTMMNKANILNIR